jgi:SAM-dependent methyltransferase
VASTDSCSVDGRSPTVTLPVPPAEMRALVGRPGLEEFLEPPDYCEGAHRRVLDLGCGCGRLARWFLSTSPPERNVGTDVSAGMIDWCRANLAAVGFEFIHQDVFNPGLNPSGSLTVAPVPDGTYDLVLALSFFTHVIEQQAEFYLDQVARVLAPDGMLISSWFLVDKTGFPMMQNFQNALYINPADPTNAVIYDRAWLIRTLSARGLVVRRVEAPAVRGFHWLVRIGLARPGERHAAFAPDQAPAGDDHLRSSAGGQRPSNGPIRFPDAS